MIRVQLEQCYKGMYFNIDANVGRPYSVELDEVEYSFESLDDVISKIDDYLANADKPITKGYIFECIKVHLKSKEHLTKGKLYKAIDFYECKVFPSRFYFEMYSDKGVRKKYRLNNTQFKLYHKNNKNE